ncbi:MAG: deoxynucleoside kinase [Bacteroidota bacterium]
MRYNFIAIEGNIGAGKTTFARQLAKRYDARLLLEAFEDNPYLANFYREPERFAFQLELSFLAERYQQLKDRLPNPELFQQLTVTDYIFDKSMIFARVNLRPEDFALYGRLFGIINQALPAPDLLVYLYIRTEKTMQQIRKRGRSYEQEIPASYLEAVHQSYFDFFKQHQHLRILIIDTESLDFVKYPADFERLLDLMDRPYEPGVHHLTP